MGGDVCAGDLCMTDCLPVLFFCLSAKLWIWNRASVLLVLFDLSGYIAVSSEKMLGMRRVCSCCRGQPLL